MKFLFFNLIFSFKLLLKSEILKDSRLGLRSFVKTETPKTDEKMLFFMLKFLFVHKIFTFFVLKMADKKAKFNFKVYDVNDK